MIRIAIGYVAVVVLCAALILLNPMDFMGRDAREARLVDAAVPTPTVAAQRDTAASVPAPNSVAATTAAILADLTAAAEAGSSDTNALVSAGEGDEALRKMSAAVLEGLRGDTPAMAEPSLEGLVAQALAAGQTDQAIDQIVNQAVAEGAVEAPAMLRTAEGRVDTAVLLASILAEAQGAEVQNTEAMGDEFGQGDLSEPTEVIEGGTLAMQVATEDVLYVVRSGDSLGSLALRFYGDAGLYTAIFKANRQVLDTPQSLSFGMKLLIPARSGL